MLAPGTQLGHYRIGSLLGAGGMGEVYRATDDRIGRDVAVKILSRSLAADPELLQRFEQEARAAGQLSHPNVLVIYDVGLADGTPYMVTELLEGETLRARLEGGPLSPRRVVEIAEQVAAGLAAAHAKGIVHRDLKPENIFMADDSRVKILDFGIAKLTRKDGAPAAEDTRTVPASLTATGAILGTASYMAPEQIRGRHTDHRADLFALGAIVYELLTGRKAFEGETPADRMSAILTVEPPPLAPDLERAIPGLGLVIRRCLEKRPEARFDSARDLAFTLRVLLEAAEGSGELPTSQGPASDTEIRFQRLTYREGNIERALFAPDGETVIFSASWEGEPLELYMTRLGSPEARPLGLGSATIHSMSGTGEMALSLRPRDVGGFVQLGVLARVPLIGGAPRELLTDVAHACWAPDGRTLAVIREIGGGTIRLEYPVGTVLYETTGWLEEACVAPDGKRVAFLSHPVRGTNGGDVLEVDGTGQVRTVASGYQALFALHYTASGDELVYSGNLPGRSSAIYAADRDGRIREFYALPGFNAIADISRSGRVLLHSSTSRMRMELQTRDGSDTRDLSWLEWTLVRDISSDGKWILFDETGPGGGEGNSVFLRPISGGSAIRLGDGVGARFSPDGSQVVSILSVRGSRIVLLPVGAGESTTYDVPGGAVYAANWIPGTSQLCVVVVPEDGTIRAVRFDIGTGATEPINSERLRLAVTSISPDGRLLLALGADSRYALYPLDGGAPTPLPWIKPMERVVRFTQDGKHVYVWERNRLPTPVHKLDLETGQREVWCEIRPRQRSGTGSLNNVCATPDGETFVYSYTQQLAELYVVEGLR